MFIFKRKPKILIKKPKAPFHVGDIVANKSREQMFFVCHVFKDSECGIWMMNIDSDYYYTDDKWIVRHTRIVKCSDYSLVKSKYYKAEYKD